ncbi:uncharacterized protein LOC105843712 isoform X1 [Hydra vulgaris]|uniref:uncharacterized protein LOC105843712 isoform X1 n=1 Tax=Hydra vulgaris TaxID=6087 RepID=UPI001F5E7681|nr:uncharacterized protein LOC105843712 isoform X1 [Hydra vulgaris]
MDNLIMEELEVLQAIFQDDIAFDPELLWLTYFINKTLALEIFLDENYPIVMPQFKVHFGEEKFTEEKIIAFANEHVGSQMLYDLIVYFKEIVEEEIKKTPVISNKANVLCSFFLKGSCKFANKCHNLHTENKKEITENKKETIENKKEPTEKLTFKKFTDTESEKEKKKPMKTAINVINRILWDESLPAENFIVGYIDRFTGIKEKKFTDFSWEDIASVDDFVSLAIPKHRIQYFKYRTAKIWDKTVRLDKIFNSTGDKEVIYDIVAEEDAKVGTIEKVEEEIVESVDEHSTFVSKNNIGRPNAFMCVPVSDSHIKSKVEQVQQYIKSCDEQLEEAFINLENLHITICMFLLQNENDTIKANNVLQSIQPILVSMLPMFTFRLNIKCVKDFRGLVVYAEIEKSPLFIKFAEICKLKLSDAGINLAGNHEPYNPHLTILKLTRPICNKLNITGINDFYYTGCKQVHFGQQTIKELRICLTGKERGPDGFYVTKSLIYNHLCSISPILPSLAAEHVKTLLEASLIQEDKADSLLSLIFSENFDHFEQAICELEANISFNKFHTELKKHLIIIRGLPGSGKSFLSSQIASSNKNISVSICSADYYFESQECAYQFTGEKIATAHAYCRNEMINSLNEKTDLIIVENSHSQRWEYQIYERIALFCGYNVTILEIPCKDESTRIKFYERCKHSVANHIHAAMWKRWESDFKARYIDNKSLEFSLSSIINNKQVVRADNVLYAALYLDDESRQLLLKEFHVVHANVHADHMTLIYKPSLEDLNSLELGSHHQVKVVGYMLDSDVEVAVVEALDLCKLPQPHITISTSKHASPKQSIAALTRHGEWVKPKEEIILQGVVGVQIAINEQESRKCLKNCTFEGSAKGNLVNVEKSNENEREVVLPVTAHIYIGPSIIRSLYIFDFDGTLFHTPGPVDGRNAFTKLTGTRWPHKGWLSNVESLLHPLYIYPGPSLQNYYEHKNKSCSLSILLTGRLERVRNGVLAVLNEHELTFSRVMLKPEDGGNGYRDTKVNLYKQEYVESLLKELPTVKELKFWDDREDNVKMIKSLSKKFPNVNFFVYNVQEKQPSFYELTLEQLLIRMGIRKTIQYDEAVKSGIDFIKDAWKAVVGDDYGKCCIHPFGSYLLQRRGDVDLCLFAPKDKSVSICLEMLSEKLLSFGLKYVHCAANIRCPRLKIKIEYCDAADVEFDITVACVLDNSLDEFNYIKLLENCEDQKSKVALKGLLFFDKIVKPALFGVCLKDFGLIVDLVCILLKKNRLKGNVFHCIRTFHVVQLVAEYICVAHDVGDLNELKNCEKFLKDFFGYLVKKEEEKWVRLFKKFVPFIYISSLVSFFKHAEACTLEYLICHGPLLDKKTNVKIQIESGDEVTLWKAKILLEASLGTCIRNLIVNGYHINPGMAIGDLITFNVSRLNEAKRTILMAKKEFENQLSNTRLTVTLVDS